MTVGPDFWEWIHIRDFILFYFFEKGIFKKDVKKQTENKIDWGKLYPEDAGQKGEHEANPQETELEGIGEKEGMEYRQ